MGFGSGGGVFLCWDGGWLLGRGFLWVGVGVEGLLDVTGRLCVAWWFLAFCLRV